MRRLVVITDRSASAQAIRLVLRQAAGVQILGFVDGRQRVTARLDELRPDVILVDDLEQEHQTLERIAEAAACRQDARIALLTLRLDAQSLDAAFDAGADVALSKAMHPIALGTVIREVARGTAACASRRRHLEAEPSPLTPREAEILRLAAEGHTNGRIARALWITEPTVKFHLSNTYRKLGVANRTEASRYAHRHALLESRTGVAS